MHAAGLYLWFGTAGGVRPSFDGNGGAVHSNVRQEMKQVLAESTAVPFLDSKAAEFLEEDASGS